MCKILRSSKTKKLIIVFLIILLLINIFPSRIQAAGIIKAAGGVILDVILDFLIFLGDTVLNILQNNFISTDKIVIQAQSDEFDSVNIVDVLMVIVGVIIIVLSIVIAVVSWGSASGVSFAGIMAGIKLIGGVIIGTAIGGAVAVKGASGIIDGLQGKFDLPMIRYTPYEIFSNQIPVFDINFISPMSSIHYEDIYSFKIGGGNSDVEMTANTVWKDILGNAGQNGLHKESFQYIGILNNSGVSGYNELKDLTIEDSIDGEYDGYKLSDFGLTQEVFNSSTGIIIEDGNDFDDWYNSGSVYHEIKDYFKDNEGEIDEEKINNYKSILKHYDGEDNTFSIRVFWIHERDIYCYECVDDGNNETRVYVLPFNSDAENVYTKPNSETGKTETHVVNKEYKSSASILQGSIATWYKTLRSVALVGLLSVLIYVGIRIIISAPSAQAKYKKMFLDWLVAVCILFVLHYLMVFILTMSTKLTEIFLEKSEPNIIVELPVKTTINGKGLPGAYNGGTPTEDDPPMWSCSFTGYLRLVAGAYGQNNKIGLSNFAHAIMYLIMVVYTCVFTFKYLRRVLYMAFLTMIAPLIALTYPLDKIKDGKAQALGLWLREYMFNALIQPIHLILYIMIVSNVMDYVVDHPVYAVVALGFLLPAEKFVRKLFGFEKADTADDNAANVVGGAAMMQGVSKLSALNKPKSHHEDNGNGRVRTADNPTDMDVPQVDTNSQVREAQNNQLSSNGTGIQEVFGNLQTQGASNEDTTRVNNQSEDPNIENKVTSTNNSTSVNFADPSIQQGGNNTQLNAATARPRQLRVPQITPATTRDNSRGFASKISSGFLNVGYEARKRSLKSKPLKKLGRFAGIALGGATLGLVGLVAGISTGEFDNTLKFTASGLGIGASVGGTLGANAGEWVSEQKENFQKGYYGSEEYNNIRYDRNFLASEDLRNMVNDRDIHSEMSGGIASEVHRARAIAKEAQEYHKAGITDSEQIKTCMKAGLTSEEGKYAIELAKTMKQGKVNTPKKRAEYKEKYRDAFKNQNDSPEKDKKINDIWDTATKIRFR